MAKLKSDALMDKEYIDCIKDLIGNENVQSMKKYIQHGNISCLEHSIFVSYTSYRICKKMGLDFRCAARGGLLHDFFLYDWHTDDPNRGLHGIAHPDIALKNATKFFHLNDLEKDIIRCHMWPLTITPPKYKEAYIVSMADKLCALTETLKLKKTKTVRRLQNQLSHVKYKSINGVLNNDR